MRGLDETDEQILTQLLDDGRTPYSEIAEAVGLSAPAVSDRIDRLREIGLIERFTIDLDRELLREGNSVLLTVDAEPGSGAELADQLREIAAVEHVFRTVDETLVCTMVVDPAEIDAIVQAAMTADAVRHYDVQLLAETAWTPALDDATLAPECVECGNTVTAEGEHARIDGTLYQFCCGSCLSSFREQYEQFQERA